MQVVGFYPEAAKGDIICPNGYQNIPSATVSEGNAEGYSTLQHIQVESKSYAVAAYIAIPDNLSKGVVRGINASLSALVPVVPYAKGHTVAIKTQLLELFANKRNPTILQIKAIKTLLRMVLLFDGIRVPRHVVFRIYMVRCLLYKRQQCVLHM